MKKIVNGEEVELSQEEESEFLASQASLSAEIDAKQPERDYKQEMPTPQESLDMLYDLGYDAWKAKIKKIKDKYPDVVNPKDVQA